MEPAVAKEEPAPAGQQQPGAAPAGGAAPAASAAPAADPAPAAAAASAAAPAQPAQPGTSPPAAGAPEAPAPEAAGAPLAQHSKTFEIPNDMVGKLIGKGGETLKRIQWMSGARVQVDHTNTTGDHRQVTVSGPSNTSVERAHQMALEIISPESPPEETAVEEVQCPQDMVGRVIGRSGETVRALQQVTRTQVRINQDFPEGVPRKITVSGTPERIADCKRWLDRLLADSSNEPMQQLMQAAQAAAGSNARILHAPKAIIAKIIGKGGSTIRDLQTKSGARIQIDQTVDPCVVSVAGNQQAVEMASRAVEDIIGGGNGFRTFHQGGDQFGGMGGGFGGGRFGVQGQFGGQAGYGGGYGSGFGFQGGQGRPQGGFNQFEPYPGGYSSQQPYGGAGYPYAQQPTAAGFAAAAAAAAAGASQVWQAVVDDQGRTYYYNSQTGQSQWEKPGGM